MPSCSASADGVGRALIALGIRVYRAWLRDALGRECLFAVSCSEHVLRAARDEGTVAAWGALATRLRTCRGDYSIGSQDGVPHALTRDGVRLLLDALAPATRQAVERDFAEAREHISRHPTA